jgi:hypothetical protein
MRADEYNAQADEVSRAVNKHQWNESGGQFVDWCRPSQHLFHPQHHTTGKASWTWLPEKSGEVPTDAASEPYLSDAGAMWWALYSGVLGIQPDVQGLTLAPRIPKALANPRVGIRLLGRHLTLRYHGHGDVLRGITRNDRSVSGNRPTWESLPDGSVLDIPVGP